jgi:hypothetical protein
MLSPQLAIVAADLPASIGRHQSASLYPQYSHVRDALSRLLYASSSRVDCINIRSEVLAVGPLALVGA